MDRPREGSPPCLGPVHGRRSCVRADGRDSGEDDSTAHVSAVG